MKKAFKLMAFVAVIGGMVFASCGKDDKDNSGNGGGSGSGSETPGSYVDLGLSSGTKWKASNEENAADVEYAFFTYDEAVAQFGDKLPSREQWMELDNECDWTWTGMGYKVVGPNGKSISLPAAGYRNCNGWEVCVGDDGRYWSSTPEGSDYAWAFHFIMGGMGMCYDYRCGGRSVRLVQD